MSVYLGKNKIGITKYENLDTELGEQEELLNDLEAEVNALEDKPKSDVQYMIDQTNSCNYLFESYKGTDLPFVKNLDTSNVTGMNSMFNGCTSLRSLDLSSFNTSNVKDMYQMFRYCSSPDFSSLDLSSFNTENVTNMNAMFQSCNKLTSLNINNFNTSNVTTMENMFYYCTSLKSLDVTSFDTKKVTTMSSMFANCTSLTSLDLSSFNTENVTSMSYMFNGCSNLTSLNISSFDTGNVSSISYMFQSCTNLVTILGTLNMIKGPSMSNMFSKCVELVDVTLKNIKKSLTLGNGTTWGTKLSNATLINTIQQLWDLTGQTSQTLTLSTTSKNNIANIYVKLITPTAEQIAADPYIERKKPCEVCEPTDDGAMLITEYLISKNWSLA